MADGIAVQEPQLEALAIAVGCESCICSGGAGTVATIKSNSANASLRACPMRQVMGATVD
ncbi:MAG: hypothetical protein HY245_15355 [Rhizobiales bacterium]|nr:hypothetical protein [Hyphomicrobiales bacterium]MBI3674764.1 hypothetical protein [Hyphomicrobiales bacterium]